MVPDAVVKNRSRTAVTCSAMPFPGHVGFSDVDRDIAKIRICIETAVIVNRIDTSAVECLIRWQLVRWVVHQGSNRILAQLVHA